MILARGEIEVFVVAIVVAVNKSHTVEKVLCFLLCFNNLLYYMDESNTAA